MEYYAGIDVGGTKIYSTIIEKKGTILSREKIKTGGKKDLDTILERIINCLKEAISKAGIQIADIKSIGIAVPSSVDVKKGLLLYSPNLGLKNIEIAKIFKQRIKKPLFIDNDGNMGVFGEYSFGAGKDSTNLYGLFIGTGIGGGFIMDNKIIRGPGYTAGEIGHMVIKRNGLVCGCGNKGCLEIIGGKVGMINYMKKLTRKKKKKTLLKKLEPDWKRMVGSSKLKEAFEKKDKIVIKAIKRSADAVGIACANLVNSIGIEAIVLGGGVIEEMGDVILPIVKKKMEKYAIAGGAKYVKLFKSKLGDDAVALGAAWFVRLPENKNMLL